MKWEVSNTVDAGAGTEWFHFVAIGLVLRGLWNTATSSKRIAPHRVERGMGRIDALDLCPSDVGGSCWHRSKCACESMLSGANGFCRSTKSRDANAVGKPSACELSAGAHMATRTWPWQKLLAQYGQSSSARSCSVHHQISTKALTFEEVALFHRPFKEVAFS